MANLEPRDYNVVRQPAEEKGLGARGFSAALRTIIREWQALHRLLRKPQPAQKR